MPTDTPCAEARTQVRAAEQQLRAAMLASDTEALDRLLAPDLLYTNHLGQVLTKADDLEAHRSQRLRITALDSADEQLRCVGTAVVVSVRVNIEGTYAGQPANGTFRFTRVWEQTAPAQWHVAAAHATAVS